MLTLYKILSVLLFPFLELYVIYRVYKKKDDKKRWRERFGHPGASRPFADVIWIHAVSVGESNSALMLIDELLKKNQGSAILFTSTTTTSASVIAQKILKYEGRVIHQFLPIDSYFCAKAFFDFWQPKMAIFLESEIWPNLIDLASKREIPSFLVNARMSKKSVSRWRFARWFSVRIFDQFTIIFAQSEKDKKHFETLTKKKVLCYGNLKSQAEKLPFDEDALTQLKSQIGSRKFWLASSTHQGEEEIMIAAHQELKKEFDDLLTIIVPRHPNRAEEIALLLADVNFAQRSKGEDITLKTEIYLADSLNELGLFYRLADFAFIGASLVKKGGHNPFEAVRLECGIISGAETFNFQDIYHELEDEDGCVMIDDLDELVKAVKGLFLGDISKDKMAREALKVVGELDTIAVKVVDEICDSE